MTNTIIEQVKSQKFFYRDYYRKVTKVLVVCQFIIVALIAAVFYFATHRPVPGFYASSSNGAITPLKPLSQPNYSNTALLN